MIPLLASLAHAGCGPGGCPPPTLAEDAPMHATAPIPPIDRERPAHVEIATFALG